MTEEEKVSALAKREAFRNNVLKAGNLDPAEWSMERIETIKKIAAPDAKSIHDLSAFLGFCAQYGLDPINGCWLMDTGKGRMGIEVSRDGWIQIANRNADFGGMDYGVVRKGEEFEIERHRGDVWVNHKTTAASSGSQIVSAYCVLYREGKRPTVVHMPFAEFNTRGPVWRTQPGIMAITRVIAFAVKTAYGITAYAQGELAGVAEDRNGHPTDEVDVAAATKAKLEAIKAADAPTTSTEEVTGTVAPPEEPIEAEVLGEPEYEHALANDELPEKVETTVGDSSWKLGREALMEEMLEGGYTEEDLADAWKVYTAGQPMDAKFKSARETWAQFNDLNARVEFLDMARTCKKQAEAKPEVAEGEEAPLF